MAAGSITGDQVRVLRGALLRAARALGSAVPFTAAMPEHLTALTVGLSSAEFRAGLAWLATLSRRTANVTSADIWLWIDTAGLRGVRVSVRDMAVRLGLSTRQAHRRIRVVDNVVAAELNAVTQGEFRRLARSTVAGCHDAELIEAVRADSYLTSSPARALDAVTMYLRNRRRSCSGVGRFAYIDGNKDARYRDASRVALWLETLAADPPVPSTSAADESRLTVCHGLHLAVEPREALAQVSLAIARRQRNLLPLLLAHAGHLIPDPTTAGTDTWLSFLQLRFLAAMEAEHVVALRYARALQAGAARLSPRGIADPQVRRGMNWRGHILQMFGHYEAALDCFAQAARHAAHYPASTEDEQQDAHDVYAQLVYTESLRYGPRADAEAALRRMHAYADRYGDRIEIQFTRQRRLLEMRLGYATRRETLVIAAPSHRHEMAIEDDFRRFLELAHEHSAPNRLLAAQDITLLYAVLTRDSTLAAAARDTFQHITNRSGGYANLTDRFNKRLEMAASLSSKFRDIPTVIGPRDPLRHPAAIPSRTTGFLVTVEHR